MQKFARRVVRRIDRVFRVRERLGIDLISFGQRGYDPEKEIVVPQSQGIYDPSVFGVYDLKSQRVLSKQQGTQPDLASFDLLAREAQRFARISAHKPNSDRYGLVLSILSSLGPGTGICLDACTGSPDEKTRKTVTGLGYRYLPIDINGDGVTVQREDLTALSFATGSIARIISLDTLEHIVEYGKAIAELYRVLCKDAYAIFHVPCYYFERPASEPINNPQQDPWGHVRYFAAKELIGSLANAGFIVVRIGFQFDYGAILCLTAKCEEIIHGEKGR
jgi:SAM-dependent methyltransferase